MVDSIAQSVAVRDVRERSTKCWGGARGGWWVEVSYGGERWAAWGGAAHLLRSCAFVITFGGLLLADDELAIWIRKASSGSQN